MLTIVVCTNFSYASRNALEYTCSLLQDKGLFNSVTIRLLNLYDLPSSYCGEGLALTTIPSEMQQAEDELADEIAWAREHYPSVQITPEFATGSLRSGLEEFLGSTSPVLVIIGAGGEYSELLSWDHELVRVFRDLSVPVLVIPQQTQYHQLNRMAFSCNIKNVKAGIPYTLIKGLVKLSNAHLDVILVRTKEAKPKFCTEQEAYVREQLEDVPAQYHHFFDSGVVNAVGQFVKEHGIDLLLVTPKKQGIWESIFEKNISQELMKLDQTPVLALREGSVGIE
jgi:hypothetical protein